MSSLVLVAIPSEDDYVWKISSEKKPHCTLLFFGETLDVPNVGKIRDFVEHAVNFWDRGPFMLDVDHRGTLGDDEADVLFFRRDWSVKELVEFRAQLLKNSAVRRAYDSVEQYPEWQPHLTLGYPESPAKEDDRDYPGIRWVHFDRIALWYGDYEGPEFRLQYDYDLTEVAMSSTAEKGAEFLSHYGVKGMRWGVRNDTSGGGAPPKPTDAKASQIINANKRSKTKIKTEGGENHPATEDAIKAAVTKQKLQRSGPAALSNAELKDLATRMQLETQVKQLSGQQQSAGKKFAKGLLGDIGKQEARRLANEKIAGLR